MRIAAVVFAVLLVTGCGKASKPAEPADAAAAPAAASSDLQQAKAFLDALKARDYAKLRTYDAAGDDFFNPDGSMRDDIDTALYGAMGSDTPGPIPAMAAQGDFKIQPVERSADAGEGRVVAVMYMSKAFTPDRAAKDFWDREWMKSYFACEFNVKDGRWTLRQNFCFADSGAPYHGAYDEL